MLIKSLVKLFKNVLTTLTKQTLTEQTLTEQIMTEQTMTEQTMTEQTMTEQTMTKQTMTEQTMTKQTLTEQTYQLITQCASCFDTIDNALCQNSVSCKNNHKLCVDCFMNQFNSQIDATSIGLFIDNKCKIVCGFCKISFNDKTLIPYLSDEQYQQLCKIREDIIISKTESECEKKMKQTYEKSKIDQYRTFICENILTLHCKKCNNAILDFDSYFAIECSL